MRPRNERWEISILAAFMVAAGAAGAATNELFSKPVVVEKTVRVTEYIDKPCALDAEAVTYIRSIMEHIGVIP